MRIRKSQRVIVLFDKNKASGNATKVDCFSQIIVEAQEKKKNLSNV
jgi:hypothetical protein